MYATVHGYLKDIAVKDIAAYESALYQYLDENVTAGGVMEAIRTTGDMKQDTEQQMKDVLAAFTADFIKMPDNHKIRQRGCCRWLVP